MYLFCHQVPTRPRSPAEPIRWDELAPLCWSTRRLNGRSTSTVSFQSTWEDEPNAVPAETASGRSSFHLSLKRRLRIRCTKLMKVHTPAVQYAKVFLENQVCNLSAPTFYNQNISFAWHDWELVRQIVLLVIVNCVFEFLPHVRVLKFRFKILSISLRQKTKSQKLSEPKLEVVVKAVKKISWGSHVILFSNFCDIVFHREAVHDCIGGNGDDTHDHVKYVVAYRGDHPLFIYVLSSETIIELWGRGRRL